MKNIGVSTLKVAAAFIGTVVGASSMAVLLTQLSLRGCFSFLFHGHYTRIFMDMQVQ